MNVLKLIPLELNLLGTETVSTANSLGLYLAIGVGAGLLVVSALLYRALKRQVQASDTPASKSPTGRTPSSQLDHVEPVSDTDHLARMMLENGRYALLLRPQIAGNLSSNILEQAMTMLDESMTIVPDGDLLIGLDSKSENQEDISASGQLVSVEGLYLDRYQVTNEQYQAFVEGGGYEEMALWDPEIWPAVLDFVDINGNAGPRYWRDGKFNPGEANLPVVGVCWYEAAAYARWVGKRLPTDPEWVKAGSWPVPLPDANPIQRKYPWGNSMNQANANLWGCGPGTLVPVDQFEGGVSVGGAYQLIGNAWEWTSSRFGAWQSPDKQLVLDNSIRSLRGGAFDTYFDHQAICDHQSGDNAVARKHNIGFRCAVSYCDIIPDPTINLPEETTQSVEEPTVAMVGE
ncbi:MAG: hypothetical protein COA78_12215 [Blastopirellula sp.]|nr:MAG: hypothetical protein COA78_12215 [Blastopirellula sp.]